MLNFVKRQTVENSIFWLRLERISIIAIGNAARLPSTVWFAVMRIESLILGSTRFVSWEFLAFFETSSRLFAKGGPLPAGQAGTSGGEF